MIRKIDGLVLRGVQFGVHFEQTLHMQDACNMCAVLFWAFCICFVCNAYSVLVCSVPCVHFDMQFCSDVLSCIGSGLIC